MLGKQEKESVCVTRILHTYTGEQEVGPKPSGGYAIKCGLVGQPINYENTPSRKLSYRYPGMILGAA